MMNNYHPATFDLQLHSLDVLFKAPRQRESFVHRRSLEKSHVSITKKSSHVTKSLWSHYLTGFMFNISDHINRRNQAQAEA